MQVTFRGNRCDCWAPLKVGDRARNVRDWQQSPCSTGAITGKDPPFPQLLPDVPVCSAAIQIQRLNSLGQELTDFVEVFLVSAEALQAIA